MSGRPQGQTKVHERCSKKGPPHNQQWRLELSQAHHNAAGPYLLVKHPDLQQGQGENLSPKRKAVASGFNMPPVSVATRSM